LALASSETAAVIINAKATDPTPDWQLAVLLTTGEALFDLSLLAFAFSFYLAAGLI
jgi:hypothetical protein